MLSNKNQKELDNYLNTIDYEYLQLDKAKYDSKEDKELSFEKSVYALVKYANEHPTLWVCDYYIDVDERAFDLIIEREYVTKVMPDDFPELFKDYTVEELIRESEIAYDEDSTKEYIIEEFMQSSDFSWTVSQKGQEYLKAHPFLDFFTNNLADFNIYEFKMYADKYSHLTLDEAGDKYVNAKLTKALSDELWDFYLNYVDYYFNLNLTKKDYETAFIYLIQRIIYEINIWILKDYHVTFDNALSIRTGYLLFKITKLNIDFDLEELYDKAYNSLRVEKVKFGYDENYDNLEALMSGDDIHDINDDLMDSAKEQGKLKSGFGSLLRRFK